MEELLINGQAVDLGDSVGITLNFNSNFFGDLSKIQGNYSYTIRLPKTLRNRQIFDDVLAVSHASSSRYVKIPASYARDGVTIIKDGQAVVIGGGKEYEIALTWGGLVNFEQWKASSAKLSDLDFGTFVWVRKPVAPFPPPYTAEVLDYETGVGSYNNMSQLAQSKAALLPSVNCWRIIEQMEATYGVDFDFSAAVEQELKLMAIPCISHNATTAPVAFSITGVNSVGDDPSGGVELQGVNASEFYTIEDGVVEHDYTQYRCSLIRPTSAGSFSLSADAVFSMESDFPYAFSEGAPAYLYLYVFDSNGKRVDGVRRISSRVKIEGPRDASCRFEESFSVLIPEGGCLAMIFYYKTVARVSETNGGFSGFVNGEEQELKLYDTLDVGYNLPDVSQVDFLKTICAIFELSAIRQGDTLRFVSMSELLSNKNKALDWTGKIVFEGNEASSSISFKVGNFSQRNNFKWVADTAPEGYGDGVLNFSNATLEDKETDATKIPFAASVGALIPLFKFSEDRTNVESSTVKPRIMRIVESSTGSAMLTFDGLSFSVLLEKYYTALREIISNAIVIKVSARLSPLDLKTLDFTTPIYLSQFGRYFAISKIETTGGRQAKVELIRLP